jgi:hypothetical protein
MKNKLLIVLYLFTANISISQSYSWITPNTSYLKMYVADDGIYRINKSDFTSAGISVTIDPRTVKVYYNGSEIPIYFYGESDGVFNDTDYFDFYGKRNYGGITNTYNTNDSVMYTTDEYFNLYSDTSAYWVGWGGTYGTRYTDYNYSSSVLYPYNYYYKKLHFEKDLFYSYGEMYNEQDLRYVENERFQGESWYWTLMQYLNTITQSFTSQYLVTSSQPCKLKIFAYPVNQNTNLTYEHRLSVSINNNLLDTLKVNHFTRIDTTIYFPSTYLSSSSSNTAKVKYAPPNTFTGGQLNFDMFEISYPNRFVFDSNIVSYSTGSTDTSSKIYKLSGFLTTNPVSIYDTKYRYRITSYVLSSDTLIFTGKGDGVFEVINKYITKKPLRIKQRTVPDYVSASNGVDYLLIYNKLFETQAEQLRAYRYSHNGFRSVKAEMEDIYDIFNYGMENPVAIRNFVKYIYDNWTQPHISYICLLGRGSLDPKKNLSSSVYYQNYVPVYGNPPSDGYFANMRFGGYLYYHQIAIGRLPAYTTTEAQNMVNKIIAYESQTLDNWIKKSVFVTGGYVRSDQQTFFEQMDEFVNSYILVPPLSMNATKIYLNDTSGTVVYNYSDSVKNSINRGASFVNYIGHSGNGYWDYTFSDPSVLSNGDLLPYIFSLSCFTGKNAEPDARGYGESFLTLSGKGAIGFVSTTGWSFLDYAKVFNYTLLQGFKTDSLRRLGDLVKFASSSMSMDSTYFYLRNTVNCYNLLGDPATTLLLPKYPEFNIQSSDYNLSNSYPAVRENITLKIYPENLGTYADSCKIRFQVLKNNLNHSIKDTIIRSWAFIDTVAYNFKLDTVGIYSVKVTLDIDNWYTQELTTNNSITIPLNVKNAAFIPVKPIDNMVITADTVLFVGINPNINTSTNTIRLIAQFDTTNSFTSSFTQTYFTNTMTGAATKFKVKIPILDSNIVYYWRLNAVVNNSDTLGWSEVRRFRSFVTLPTDFLHSSKKGKDASLSDSKYSIPTDSNITIYENKAGQYRDYELSCINTNNGNLKNAKFTGTLIASSFGPEASDPTYFVINNISIYLTRTNLADEGGFFLVKVNKIFGSILNATHFYMSSTSSSDSVLSFLNTFDSTNILLAVKLTPKDISLNSLNESAKSKFRQMGSYYIDSITVTSWNRWSFISYPDSSGYTKSEAFDITSSSNWKPTTSSMQPTFSYPNGTVTQTFGPAKTWKNFSWQQTLNTGTSIKYDVYGIDRNNAETLLMSNLLTNTNVDLQSINSYTYPCLKLVGKLIMDTTTSTQSPVLQAFKLYYVAPSEIALDYNTFIKSDSLLNGGDSLGISLAYYNVGYVGLYGYTRSIYTYNTSGQKVILKSDTNTATLKIDSADYVKTSVKLVGLPNIKKYNNYIILYFEVTPYGMQNDLYTYNNVTATNIVVKGTSQVNNVELYSDGVKVSGGEYVRTTPEMEIKLTGKYLTNFDTTDFKVFINNIYQPYYSRTTNGLIVEGSNSKSDISIKFSPSLPNGESIFKLVSRSGSEEDYDTAKYSVSVSNQLLVKDFYNYPNPMKNQTVFIFNLGGSNPPASCKIKVYSVSGRLVKIINTAVNIGYNQITWDGRDNEGDYMANGIYLYRMIIEGDTKIESSVQKLVILK